MLATPGNTPAFLIGFRIIEHICLERARVKSLKVNLRKCGKRNFQSTFVRKGQE